MNRIDLHNHSYYSNIRLKDAMPSPKQMIDRAIEIGLKGIAITDHEALCGHPKANIYGMKIAETNPDFKVLLGNEIYLVDERPSQKHYHFLLICKDAIGHRQLRELSSIAWLHRYNTKGIDRVDTLKSDLEKIINKNKGHLIASTACIGGELGQMVLELEGAERFVQMEEAYEIKNKIADFILWCKELFGDDFYIEAQPGISKEQVIVNKRVVAISKTFDVKMIPTSDSHYLKKEDRFVHKSYLNSENKEREVDSFYADAYLHTSEEMIEKFAASGFSEEFVLEMFNNTMEIYDKVERFSLLHPQQIPKVSVKNYPKTICTELPDYPVLTAMYNNDDVNTRYWVNECVNKLKELNLFNKTYLDELEEEADVKRVVGEKLNTNMYRYPLLLQHYMGLIYDRESLVGVGRGSACSALNHYLLGITQLDPVQWNFPFFRYMNRDTEGLGDIDIDLSPSRVPGIVQAIRKERGAAFSADIEDELVRSCLGATYVATFGTVKTKNAVLIACRGYRSEDFPNGIEVDVAQYLSSLIPSERGFIWPLHDVVYGNEEKGRKPIPAFVNEVAEYDGLLDIMFGIEGCIQNRSRHASGVLLMDEDPFEFNAFMLTSNGEITTQYDLHDAEACGSVKLDLLVTDIQEKIGQSLKLLQNDNVIEQGTLKEAYDKNLHPDVLPIDDKATWKTIQEASSLDLFQLDSEVGRQGAKKVKPENMSELSSTNGLIRLMTTEKGAESYLDKFVRYKTRPSDLQRTYLHYGLTDVEIGVLSKYIGETYGIGISQEQLMKVLMDKDVCGFNLKTANWARKVVSKKQLAAIPQFKELVFETAKSDALANYVWDNVVGPGLGYSFNFIGRV